VTTSTEAVPVVTEAHVEQQLGDPAGLLVGLDFDGTLAPIADDPDAPTITPENRTAVAELAGHQAATVAVISGRQLADLRPRVGIDGIRYVGNHGLEYTVEGNRQVHPEAQDATDQLRRAQSAIADRLDHVPDVEIEDKELTLTVHYRRAPAEYTAAIQATVDEVVADADGLITTTGKEIVEVRPAVKWDKGHAVDTLRGKVPEEWAAVYVGDDTTDEDAFRTLESGDLGVLVGDRDTAADYRLTDQADVSQLLAWLNGTVESEG